MDVSAPTSLIPTSLPNSPDLRSYGFASNVTINNTVNGTINNAINGTTTTDISIPSLVVLLIFLAISIPFLEYFRHYCMTGYPDKIYIDDEFHDTSVETTTEYD